jgi:hypothetical protein
MRALVIDSHKGLKDVIPQNLHWKNAKTIADLLGAKLIWSYKGVNDEIESDYDVIVFVHASAYEYVDRDWVRKSPNAKLFYVTNEYNLGEARILWTAAKEGRRYDVIANHEPDISRVTKKYVDNWNVVNLNALCYSPKQIIQQLTPKHYIYYGSFRKGRKGAYLKYLGLLFNNQDTLISTHQKNREKFDNLIEWPENRYIDRIDWDGRGLSLYKASIYLEDYVTHESYNYLANRFYEALNYHIPTVFAEECINTVEKSGLEVPPELYARRNELPYVDEFVVPTQWYDLANSEKSKTKNDLLKILTS